MGVNQSRSGPDAPGGSREAPPRFTPDGLAEARAALRMRFLVLAPRRVAALRAALRTAAVDDIARRDLQRLGHQLRGTAATVGLPELGLLGGVIERTAAAGPYTDDHQARVASAVALVEECLAHALTGRGGPALADDPRFLALSPGGR